MAPNVTVLCFINTAHFHSHWHLLHCLPSPNLKSRVNFTDNSAFSFTWKNQNNPFDNHSHWECSFSRVVYQKSLWCISLNLGQCLITYKVIFLMYILHEIGNIGNFAHGESRSVWQEQKCSWCMCNPCLFLLDQPVVLFDRHLVDRNSKPMVCNVRNVFMWLSVTIAHRSPVTKISYHRNYSFGNYKCLWLEE